MITTVGEIYKHDKSFPERMFGSMTKNIMQITILRCLTRVNRNLVDLANDGKDTNGLPVTPADVLTTLLTIEYAVNQYLPAGDRHKVPVQQCIDRTILLGKNVLQQHGLLEDFNMVVA